MACVGEVRKNGGEMMEVGSWRKIYLPVILLAILLFLALLNIDSLGKAQDACISNDKVPMVEKTILAFHWSVHCK